MFNNEEELRRKMLEGIAAQRQGGPADHRAGLGMESRKASGFADSGQEGFGRLGLESDKLRGQLGDIASGKVSLSAEQLRQGLQQNVAGQQAMAASARPGSAPMAARTAMNGAARAGSGLAGQQAMAGIAERQAAQQSLANFLSAQRGQELQAALGARGQSITGYGAVAEEEARRRAEEAKKQGAWGLIGGGLIGGALGSLGGPAGAAAGARVGAGLGSSLGEGL